MSVSPQLGTCLIFFLSSIYIIWQWAILHTIYLSNKSRGTGLFLRINNLLGTNDPQPWKRSLTPKKCPALKLLLIWVESVRNYLWKKRGKAECLEFIFLHVTISLANPKNDAPRIRKNVLCNCSSYSRNLSQWYNVMKCIWLYGSWKILVTWHSERKDWYIVVRAENRQAKLNRWWSYLINWEGKGRRKNNFREKNKIRGNKEVGEQEKIKNWLQLFFDTFLYGLVCKNRYSGH